MAISGFAFSASAEAHFDILTPEPADSATDGGKGPPPCGPVADTNVITPAQGGHPLTLALSETVFHVGFYRVALALNAPSELPPDNTDGGAAGAPRSGTISDSNGCSLCPPRRDFSPLWFGLLAFVVLTAARRRR